MNTTALQGRLALVTGASRGLGRSIASELARHGASLALVAREPGKLAEAVEEIRAIAEPFGGKVEGFTADVAKEDSVLALEKAVSETLGKVQILVNNAGYNQRKNLTDFTYDEWRGIMDTNVNGVFLMCRSFVPHMEGTGYGRILNMASMMGHVSLPQRAAYSTTKFAVRGLTTALALELAAGGVTVNSISPGPFATEMNARAINDPEMNAFFVSRIPVGRWGKVEEIGPLAAFLCSEDAAFITGTDILIDGGWCAL
jgi:NAD(P)-dependent dehydrogenase (short-subunit alcohol dehydrogenase family)